MKFGLFLFFLHIVFLSNAQLCPGSLGDPILNVTFGQGHKDATPLPSSVNSYSFTGGCPNKGEYTINNFIFGCAGGTWVQTIGDHTHDQDGNYLMVNAESTPGDIYVTKVNNLCNNTTYQFSVWVMNVMFPRACNKNPVHPQLNLSIETTSGTVLGTYSTGNINETDDKIWRQFGMCITTPPNISSLVLKITTHPQNGCGSAFMIDDITLSALGPAVKIALDGDSTDKSVCSGYSNPFLFKGNYSSGFTDPVVQWQISDSGIIWKDIAGATTLEYAMPKRNSGKLFYRMVVAERANINSPTCRIASNPIFVSVKNIPDQHSTSNIFACTGIPFQLIDTSFQTSYRLSYHWTGPNGFQSDLQSPIINNVNISDSGKYAVKLTTDFGCSLTDTFIVKVVTGSQVQVTPLISNICDGQSINFNATQVGTYIWAPTTGLSSPSIANPIATPHDSINYLVTLTNPSGCKSFQQVTVNVSKVPIVSAGSDKSILKGDSILLDGQVSGSNVNYYWTPAKDINDPKSLTPIVYPSVTTIYTLYAISQNGCGTFTSNVTVKVFKDIYIPTAFSPNGNGINDRFHVYLPANFVIKSFGIFNRLGTLLYKVKNNVVDWDGTYKGEPQPVGIYVYSLEMDGPSNRHISRKGTFLLIR